MQERVAMIFGEVIRRLRLQSWALPQLRSFVPANYQARCGSPEMRKVFKGANRNFRSEILATEIFKDKNKIIFK